MNKIGDKSGKLTIIETGCSLRSRTRTYSAYRVRCECGKEKLVLPSNFRIAISCGCIGKRTHGETPKGQQRPKLYIAWANMKSRCNDDRVPSFHRYGGRGITVCEEWSNSYIAFRDWALSHGYAEGLELDRRNNNGNYTPDNCRWITRTENNKNKG